MWPSETAKVVPAFAAHDLRNSEQLPGRLIVDSTEIHVPPQVKRLSHRFQISIPHAALIAVLAGLDVEGSTYA